MDASRPHGRVKHASSSGSSHAVNSRSAAAFTASAAERRGAASSAAASAAAAAALGVSAACGRGGGGGGESPPAALSARSAICSFRMACASLRAAAMRDATSPPSPAKRVAFSSSRTALVGSPLRSARSPAASACRAESRLASSSPPAA